MSKNLKIELYHDILARKIYERAGQEDKLRLQLQRLLRDRSQLHRQGKGGLLTQKELALINSYLNLAEYPAEQREYLEASREQIRREEEERIAQLEKEKKLLQKQRRQQRYILIGTLLGALALAVSLFFIWRERQKAVHNKKLADQNREIAEDQSDTLREYSGQLLEQRDSIKNINVNLRSSRDSTQEALTLSQRAKLREQQAKQKAQRQALAYRLIVLGNQQLRDGRAHTGFQIGRRAQRIYSDSTVVSFMVDAFNALPREQKLLQTYSSGAPWRNGQIVAHLPVWLGRHPSNLTLYDAPGGARTLNDNRFQDISRAAISSDGNRLAIAQDDRLTIWDVTAQTVLRERDFNEAISHLSWQSNSPVLLATAAEQGFLWDTDEAAPIPELNHSKPINSAFFTLNGKILTTGKDGAAKLWTPTGDLIESYRHPVSLFYPLRARISPDERYLALIGVDEKVYLWERGDKDSPRILQHLGAINTIRFSEDSQFLLTASQDEKAIIWHVEPDKRTLLSHGRTDDRSVFIYRAIFSPDTRFVVTASPNALNLWSREGAPLGRLPVEGKTLALEFTPNGASVLALTDRGNIYQWLSYDRWLDRLPPASPVTIDSLKDGFEMPDSSWFNTQDTTRLRTYVSHWARKADNFDPVPEQLRVLRKSVLLYEKYLKLQGRKPSNVGPQAWFKLIGISATAGRHLQVGHAYLLEGRREQALAHYRQARQMSGGEMDRASFAEALRKEFAQLRGEGFQSGYYRWIIEKISQAEN